MYRYQRTDGAFAYERWWIDTTTLDTMREVLHNDGLVRFANGVAVAPEENKAAAYGASVNSVVYVALLPWALLDPKARYLGRDTIKGRALDQVEVSFAEAPRHEGHDMHQDEYLYWFAPDTHELAYMSYAHADGKAPRLREPFDEPEAGGAPRLLSSPSPRPPLQAHDPILVVHPQLFRESERISVRREHLVQMPPLRRRQFFPHPSDLLRQVVVFRQNLHRRRRGPERDARPTAEDVCVVGAQGLETLRLVDLDQTRRHLRRGGRLVLAHRKLIRVDVQHRLAVEALPLPRIVWRFGGGGRRSLDSRYAGHLPVVLPPPFLRKALVFLGRLLLFVEAVQLLRFDDQVTEACPKLGLEAAGLGLDVR